MIDVPIFYSLEENLEDPQIRYEEGFLGQVVSSISLDGQVLFLPTRLDLYSSCSARKMMQSIP